MSIKEKLKTRIALERQALQEDRLKYTVPTWKHVLWIVGTGLILTAIVMAGGFD